MTGWKSGSDLTLPDGPRSTGNIDIDPVEAGYTNEIVYASAYQDSLGRWKVKGVMSFDKGSEGSVNGVSISVPGVTFHSSGDINAPQAVTAHGQGTLINSGRQSVSAVAKPSTDEITFYASVSNIRYISVEFDVFLTGKPTDAFVGADSRFSTFDEALEGKPVIKLYSDETSAVSVGVTPATETVAGTVKLSSEFAAGDGAYGLVEANGITFHTLANTGTSNVLMGSQAVEVGSFYRVSIEANGTSPNSAGATAGIEAKDGTGGSVICRARIRSDNSYVEFSVGSTYVYQATNATLEFRSSISTGGTVNGKACVEKIENGFLT